MTKLNQTEKDKITKIKEWIQQPIYFFKDCILTVDEARGNLGFPAIRPMPISEEYIQLTVQLIVDNRVLIINKSRRMMATWIVCAFALWKLLFFPNVGIYVVSRKSEEANDLLNERVWFMYENIPEEYKTFLPKLTKKFNIIECEEMGGFIKGVASGPDQIRGKTASLVIWDETSSTDYILDTWKSLGFTIKGGGQVVVLSTPRLNDFMVMWEGLRTALRK